MFWSPEEWTNQGFVSERDLLNKAVSMVTSIRGILDSLTFFAYHVGVWMQDDSINSPEFREFLGVIIVLNDYNSVSEAQLE